MSLRFGRRRPIVHTPPPAAVPVGDPALRDSVDRAVHTASLTVDPHPRWVRPSLAEDLADRSGAGDG